ncbi:MAG: hypothetical protein ABI459_04090 [Deltaproteobacteria bacterium]
MIRTLIALACLATPVLAQDTLYYSSLGDGYAAEVNANGVIFTSEYPKHYFMEDGVNSRIETRPEVIYLGKSCDAESFYWGKGRFGQANGGFLITFENGHELGFARQELPGDVASCPLE